MKTIQEFKQGEFHLLVATDVAARGIHIDGLSLVVNYDVPNDKDNYIHRIGRTGRAGKTGRAITLVTGEDIMSLYEIEEHIGAMIAEEELPLDADLNAQKAETEKWIQAQKAKPPRMVSQSNPKEAQRKSQYAKPPQYRETYRDRPVETDRNHKTAQKTSTMHDIGQPKAVQNIIKPLAPHSAGTGAAVNKDCTDIIRSGAPSNKKSLLQRVISRIFGK
jgi:superfamily II DNA/RNA helicase